MADGFFSKFRRDQMESASATPGDVISLLTDTIAIVLWPEANAPTLAQLRDGAIIDIGDLELATGGAIQDVTTHSKTLIGKTVGTDGLFSASNTQFDAPSAGNDCDIMVIRLNGAQPASGDELIYYNDLDTPITPQGVAQPVNFPSGIFRYGQA